jgi:hypothetical protein
MDHIADDPLAVARGLHHASIRVREQEPSSVDGLNVLHCSAEEPLEDVRVYPRFSTAAWVLALKYMAQSLRCAPHG